MTGIAQVKKGAVQFVEKHLAPLLPTGVSVALMAFGPIVIESKIDKYIRSDWLADTPLVDGENIDIDTMYTRYREKASNKWPLELFGFKFAERDLDTLYRMIKEA